MRRQSHSDIANPTQYETIINEQEGASSEHPSDPDGQSLSSPIKRLYTVQEEKAARMIFNRFSKQHKGSLTWPEFNDCTEALKIDLTSDRKKAVFSKLSKGGELT